MERPPGKAERQTGAERPPPGEQTGQGGTSPAQFLAERTRQDIDQEQWEKHAGIGHEAWGSHPEEHAHADGEQHRGSWQQQRYGIPPPTESPAHDSAEQLAESSSSVGSSSDNNADNIRE